MESTHRQIQRVNANLFLGSTEDPDEKSTNEQILESSGMTRQNKKKMHSQNKEAGTSLEGVVIQSSNTVGGIVVG